MTTAHTAPQAEYVPGIGWMYVTEKGRFGNFETEAEALAALAKDGIE